MRTVPCFWVHDDIFSLFSYIFRRFFSIFYEWGAREKIMRSATISPSLADETIPPE